jgi:hypothetical protein
VTKQKATRDVGLRGIISRGQYQNPVSVVAFNTGEGWSRDVLAGVAREVRYRCDLQMRDVPFYLKDFVERYEGRYHDVQLPLPMHGL